MTTPLLKSALEPALRRRRRVQVLFRLAICWGCAAVAGVALLASGKYLEWGALILALAAAVIAWFAARVGRKKDPDYREVARTIEARHPELHGLLATAVEQRPDPKTGRWHYLQRRVILNAIAAARKDQWLDLVPRSRITSARAAHLGALIGLIVVLVLLAGRSAIQLPESFTASSAVTVTPGDVALERGSGLVVLAKFAGAIPAEATLLIEPQAGAAHSVPLTRNLDDPAFGGGLPEVTSDLRYRVEFAGGASRNYRVTVFDHPRLERADAKLTYPQYTALDEKLIPDTRRITAVEGTALGMEFHLNKPVKSAALVAKDGTSVPLAIETGKPLARLEKFALQKSQAYELRLADADGRESKAPAQILVEVLPNRRPDLKLVQPKGDQRVSPLQEVTFAAEAWDDFGMSAFGLSCTVAGGEEKQFVFARDTKADERARGEQMLELEELGVKPDELISWFIWADDIGPDGKSRRSVSDIFFAEVRPFEEIYRAGDDSAGQQQQQSGSGDAAMKLADLQKQIITATWNLKRAEDGANPAAPSPKYLADEPVVRDSQKVALAQAEALGERIDQPKTRALLANVTREMEAAVEQLTAAATSTTPLPEALRAEQAAYNALLKLAAHEFRVSRSRMSSSSGENAAERQQAQLDQLELKDEKDRYESRREAEPAQNEQQREQLALLNRLKELARRQEEINERLKELQTALQEAKTEREKEELRRELKRLQDEQQRLLADVDEARQKMEQSANRSELGLEQRQLEQTRNEAQQAAEAMERGAVPQALAAGTRAERDLRQLRDEFRKKTAGQFNDEMREMRSEARQLADAQQQLGQQIREERPATEQRTLDGSSPREQLAEKFEQQQTALGELRENMQRVSEQAEAGEPLLSKELYDTLRRSAQAGTDETLRRAGQLASRGYTEPAQKFEEKARKEIDELKTGVERAAESVLGNEAEALKLARAEIDQLSQQIEREIARATGASPEQASEKSGASDAVIPSEALRGGGKAADGQRTVEEPPAQQGRDQHPGESAQQSSPTNPNARGNQPGQRQSDQTSPEAGRGPSTALADARSAQNDSEGEARGEQPSRGSDGSAQESPGNARGSSNAPQRGSARNGSGGEARGNQAPTPNERAQSSEQPRTLRELASQPPRQRGGIRSGGGDGTGAQGGGVEFEEGPLRGDGFVEWSDRLRNVEEVLDSPELRNQVAEVREFARSIRAEFKRHSVEPQWAMVRTKISAPLAELRNRLTEELAKRESKESLVPIDRDPVPPRFTESVRRYYEELGRAAAR